jgi:transketolase
VLTRQVVPTLARAPHAAASGLRRGAYILNDCDHGDPELILIGTGSEVSLCVRAYDELRSQGVRARVVSMPSWELFENEDQAYRDFVLPPQVRARVSVEAASPLGWDRYVGSTGARIAMLSFGASAPYNDLYRHFGFTVEHVLAAARDQIEKHKEHKREPAEITA